MQRHGGKPTIMLVVALNLLYNNFEIIIALLFYLGNKGFKEIELIITFTDMANLVKLVIVITRYLTLIAKEKVL